MSDTMNSILGDEIFIDGIYCRAKELVVLVLATPWGKKVRAYSTTIRYWSPSLDKRAQSGLLNLLCFRGF